MATANAVSPTLPPAGHSAGTSARLFHECAAAATAVATQGQGAARARRARTAGAYTQCRSLHSSRRLQETFYEVLGVARNASQADIKKAYIELSKRLHPDRSAHKSDAEQERDNTRYQTVTEAYNTLSRPIDRRDYDNKLFHSQSGMTSAAATAAGAQYRPPSYKHRDIYDNIHFGESPYKVFSNTAIVMLAIVWMLAGIAWHYFAINKTKTELEEHLERLSREAAKDHALARKRARDNGYKKQLEILMAQQRSNANDHY